ncbi:hypothetical protein DSO57_1030785 [Entomophthora muscae]|uniref:Uncharacterized protein n=1 Tax=Entomophthora muscae TaxID=34485 RepID=A0ACC2RFI5_9FUNG|nr:hypothetical protein DSO57_1030785 [Entomophthora muscae]
MKYSIITSIAMIAFSSFALGANVPVDILVVSMVRLPMALEKVLPPLLPLPPLRLLLLESLDINSSRVKNNYL